MSWLIIGYISCLGRHPRMTDKMTVVSCFSWWKGRCPLSISKAVIPKAHMSVATVVCGALPAIPSEGASNSHAIQRRVPPTPKVVVFRDELFPSLEGIGNSSRTYCVVKTDASNLRETPKSMIHASPRSFTRIFEDFISP
jgi:hypothetical protein